MSFLRQVMGKKEKVKIMRRAASDRALQEAGTQLLMTYIDRMQATVAELMDLRPIFEVCAKETGYKGGGRHRDLLWR